MAANTLNILTPSVNNLTARIFVRAAGLDFEEVDVWGKTTEPEFLAKDPAHLTPMLEEEGLPRGTLGESCAIMAYLCNKHGLDQFYPTDPGERAMVDNANFYLIGTLYPLVARATYPTLGFPQYPGEVGDLGGERRAQGAGAARRRDGARRAARRLPRSSSTGRDFIGGDAPVDRRHPPVPRRSSSCRRSTTTSRVGERVHGARRVRARRRLLGARGRRPRLRRVG